MKKRAKIITTIASLCLAVALMAFGVYAATNVTLTVNSKVNFTVTDVFVDVTGEAKVGAAENTAARVGDLFQAYSYIESNDATVTKADGLYNGTDTTANGYAANNTWTTDALTLTSTNIYAVYVLTVENKSTTASIKVTMSADFLATLEGTWRKGSYTITPKTGNATTVAFLNEDPTLDPTAQNTTYDATWAAAETKGIQIGPEGTIVFTLVRVLDDMSTSIAAGESNNSINGGTVLIYNPASDYVEA